MIYVMPWEDQVPKDTGIFLVRPKSLDLAHTTIESDIHHFLSNVMDLSNANTVTLEQEGSTSANIEQVDTYKTIFQSLLRREILDRFVVRTQWEEEWDRWQFSSQGEPAVNVETLESDKFFDTTTELNTPATIQWGKIITTNIEPEDSNETSSYYLQRREILDRFNILAQREDNWDGYESKKPSQSTLNHAKFLIEELLDSVISVGYSWLMPFISSDENGYITAEWYEGERELHLLIGENEAESLQVWGTNIDTEMHEDFLIRDNYLTLWEWLFHV